MNTIRDGIAIAALITLSCSSYAETICDRLSDRIESAIKEISYETFSGIGDNSAPREANRQLKIIAGYNALQLTVLQQQAAKCKPYLEPVNGVEYKNDALKCTQASASASRTYDEIEQVCARKSWKRGQ